MRPDFFGLEALPEEASPRALDVVFIGRGERLAHCGVAVETQEGLRIMHCPEALCGVVLDSIPELRLAGFPRIRWFRHRDMDAAMQKKGYIHD